MNNCVLFLTLAHSPLLPPLPGNISQLPRGSGARETYWKELVSHSRLQPIMTLEEPRKRSSYFCYCYMQLISRQTQLPKWF